MRSICIIALLMSAVVLTGCSHVEGQASARHIDEGVSGVDLDYRQMDERSRILRPFALKKMPSLWGRIQSMRAELEVQDEKIHSFREQLIRFGRVPGEDKRYLRLCKEHNGMAVQLKKMFAELEQAYLNARMYESSVGEKGFETKRSRQYQDGIDDAKMMQMHYDTMLKKK